MYKTQAETRAFFAALKPLVAGSTHCDIVVAPPSPALAAAGEAVRGSAIAIAAQDVHWEKEGAFTGEVSTKMLVEAGCRGVIIGHSERRQYFGETDEAVNKKLKAALEADLVPIVCAGETLKEREAGQTERALNPPFRGGFSTLRGGVLSRSIIAYEPGWAIGTGRPDT